MINTLSRQVSGPSTKSTYDASYYGDTIILELTVGTCYKQNKIVLRSLCVVAEENYTSSSREEREKKEVMTQCNLGSK